MSCRYLQFDNFLDASQIDLLLNYVSKHERNFTVSEVGNNGNFSVDTTTRVSRYLKNLGEFDQIFTGKINEILPDCCKKLGLKPFDSAGIEGEIIATGNGGFYQKHIDTFYGPDRAIAEDRLLTFVYYFYREPQRFTGGELVVYPLSPQSQPSTEPATIPIKQNMAIAFPSWVPHQVCLTKSSSTHFMDSRFSVNLWALRSRNKS